MEVTFLGTGTAFSAGAYNASILVDRLILLDAGAPLCVHLPRAGVPLTGPRAVFLTHFHADHTFGLASLMLGRALLPDQGGSLLVVGPLGTRDYLVQLLDLAWGEEMRRLTWDRLQVRVTELGHDGVVDFNDYRVRAFEMTHTSRFPCLGYVLENERVRLGYTGDSEVSANLDSLLRSCDHVIAEMTYAEPGQMHLSRVDIMRLMQAHPQVRFVLTHRGSDQAVNGAVLARDFLTLRLPLS